MIKKLLAAVTALAIISSPACFAETPDGVYVGGFNVSNKNVTVTCPTMNQVVIFPRSSFTLQLKPNAFPFQCKFEDDDSSFILEFDEKYEIKDCALSVYEAKFLGFEFSEPALVYSRRCDRYYEGSILDRIIKK